MDFAHITVLLEEAVDSLLPERGGIFVDCTAGGGGHSEAILKRLPEGSRLISLDRDDRAIERCRERLAPYGDASTVVKTNYSEIGQVLDELGIDKIDGVLWDLGVSSVQLDERERGFSYSQDAPLDMRMDRSEGPTAADIVNGYSEGEVKPIETTVELADIITNAIPQGARKKENQHPAKRSFQAIRIEVNDELNIIEPSIRCAVERLRVGGRAAVITFHSLEDRITKQTFKNLERPCTCPSDFPVCVCGKTPSVKLVTKKPTVPTDEELELNPRARSAKLRVAEKI